jgi:hypothetical protein
MTIADLITIAYRELGVAALVGDLQPELASLGLSILNRLVDSWNGQYGPAYAQRYDTFTLSIGTNPHTIGPSGATWTITQRPVSIEAATLIDGDMRYPIDPTMTAAEYAAMSTHATESTYPRRLYYNPKWANGEIYFNRVPDAAKSVELLSRVVISALVLTDTLSLPPGYHTALSATLKEELVAVPTFAFAASPTLEKAAMRARADIFDNNSTPPRLNTRDAGVPGSGGTPYDFKTGVVG